MDVNINELLANVKQKVGADYAELVVENAVLRAQVAALQARVPSPTDRAKAAEQAQGMNVAPAPSAPTVVS